MRHLEFNVKFEDIYITNTLRTLNINVGLEIICASNFVATGETMSRNQRGLIGWIEVLHPVTHASGYVID